MSGFDTTVAFGLSVTATTLATQVLKWKVVPIPAEKYPRLTAIILAAICSAVVVWQSQAGSMPKSVAEWIAMTALSVITASLAYNNILKTEQA